MRQKYTSLVFQFFNFAYRDYLESFKVLDVLLKCSKKEICQNYICHQLVDESKLHFNITKKDCALILYLLQKCKMFDIDPNFFMETKNLLSYVSLPVISNDVQILIDCGITDFTKLRKAVQETKILARKDFFTFDNSFALYTRLRLNKRYTKDILLNLNYLTDDEFVTVEKYYNELVFCLDPLYPLILLPLSFL